jgi:Sulfotransferase family
VGEAAVSDHMVQFVKTHFPERPGHPVYPASRAVLLVRNPYDAIESYFNLMMTNTHTTTIDPAVREKSRAVWNDMVLKEIVVWRDFHEYWLAQNIPMLVVRYEDLIRYTDKVMDKALRFVLEINNMGFFSKRIDQCVAREDTTIDQLGSYKPRSGGIGKSLSKYSPELLQQMNSMGIIATMSKFGYKEMLVPKPEEWRLEPLDEYGVEIDPELAEIKPLAVNGERLVRTADLQTDWIAVRRQLGIGPGAKCTCYKCSQIR